MDIWIIIGLACLIVGLLAYGAHRSRKTRTLGGGSVIGDTIERPTRPFDNR